MDSNQNQHNAGSSPIYTLDEKIIIQVPLDNAGIDKSLKELKEFWKLHGRKRFGIRFEFATPYNLNSYKFALNNWTKLFQKVHNYRLLNEYLVMCITRITFESIYDKMADYSLFSVNDIQLRRSHYEKYVFIEKGWGYDDFETPAIVATVLDADLQKKFTIWEAEEKLGGAYTVCDGAELCIPIASITSMECYRLHG